MTLERRNRLIRLATLRGDKLALAVLTAGRTYRPEPTYPVFGGMPWVGLRTHRDSGMTQPCGHVRARPGRSGLCWACRVQGHKDRFDALIDRSGGPEACWPWRGPVNGAGYGVWSSTIASRVVLAATLGRPVNGDTRHSCDNRACCNPAHLSEGSRLDNMRDMASRGRRFAGPISEATRRKQSLNSAKRKLSYEAAAEIRAALATGASVAALARLHGVAPGTIDAIRSGRTFRFAA